MDDLISRQAAIDAIEEYADRLQMVNWKENPNVPYKVHSLNWCINTIRDLPSAQPEIIRCRDCKHYNAGFECLIEGYGVERDKNWYCGDAERRADDSISD